MIMLRFNTSNQNLKNEKEDQEVKMLKNIEIFEVCAKPESLPQKKPL